MKYHLIFLIAFVLLGTDASAVPNSRLHTRSKIFNYKATHNKRARKVRVPELLGDEIILPVISIYDGDTIMTSLTLPPPLNAISVRINGLDTPEKPAKSYKITGKLGRAKCDKEAVLALEATAYLQKFQSDHGGAMTVKNFKYGAYAGRIVGDVYIGGVLISEHMIGLGYAVPYDGKSKRSKDWCSSQ